MLQARVDKLLSGDFCSQGHKETDFQVDKGLATGNCCVASLETTAAVAVYKEGARSLTSAALRGEATSHPPKLLRCGISEGLPLRPIRKQNKMDPSAPLLTHPQQSG